MILFEIAEQLNTKEIRQVYENEGAKATSSKIDNLLPKVILSQILQFRYVAGPNGILSELLKTMRKVSYELKTALLFLLHLSMPCTRAASPPCVLAEKFSTP